MGDSASGEWTDTAIHTLGLRHQHLVRVLIGLLRGHHRRESLRGYPGHLSLLGRRGRHRTLQGYRRGVHIIGVVEDEGHDPGVAPFGSFNQTG